VKLAIVVQRYGADISGGAELHARYIAELLARRHSVEVLTTCAHDYVTWRGTYAEGVEQINGVSVRRFAVAQERDPEDFGRRSTLVFDRPHSVADELAWLDSEGPTSPALIEHIGREADAFDAFIFFSYRYYHAWHGIRRVANKALLVPTAERDAALGLSIFAPIFKAVRGLFYNSPEERAMIEQVAGNASTPNVVVGVGSAVPRETSPERFRRTFDLREPYIVYVGRIDENKGCRELFDYFTNYRPRLGQRLSLVLMGTSLLPIPNHPHIRHLGFVSDRDKFDGIAGAEALVMPSYYESLSMVALEAWALGRPVLANGRCDVLRGQVVRSRAGLYYESFEEFAETLFTLTTNRTLNAAFGENGRAFYDQHYAWPVIERKYHDMLSRMGQPTPASTEPRIAPLPGWLSRRRKTLPAAAAVVDALPRGPVLGDVRPGDDAGPAGRRAPERVEPRRESGGGPAPFRPSPSRHAGPPPANQARPAAASSPRPQDRSPGGPSQGRRADQGGGRGGERGGDRGSADRGGGGRGPSAASSGRGDRARQGRHRRSPRR
jgi:glycosyltransferase involved in cell wall biosynthesis